MRPRQVLLIAASAFAMAAPVVSHASAATHFVGGELGWVEHSGSNKSTKTRAEVVSEVKAAQADGSLRAAQIATQFGLWTPAELAPSSKSREQVVRELLNESPAARQLRMQNYYPGG